MAVELAEVGIEESRVKVDGKSRSDDRIHTPSTFVEVVKVILEAKRLSRQVFWIANRSNDPSAFFLR